MNGITYFDKRLRYFLLFWFKKAESYFRLFTVT